MDVLFLTGAGDEPGQTIARRLVGDGFRVYGFAPRFPEDGLAHADFIPVPVNPADPAGVSAAIAAILARETTLTGVIHAARYEFRESFESIHPDDIPLSVNAAITMPLLLAHAALPALVRRRGFFITITRGNGAAPTPAALDAALDGAMCEFTRSLFAELRGAGVKAARIHLEENSGAPDPTARIVRAPQSKVQPDIVADAIDFILRLRENNALTELVLRPQTTSENPRLPVTGEPRLRIALGVKLPPPEKFPPPEEAICTPRRKRPDYAPPPGTEDELPDDDDNSVDPELQYLIRPTPNNNRRQYEEQAPVANETEADDACRGGPTCSPDTPPVQPQPPAGNRRDRKPRVAIRIHAPTTESIAAANAASRGGPASPPGAPPQPPPANNRSVLPPPAPLPKRNPPLYQPIQLQQQQPSPYPENWHGPRPPTKSQRKEAEKRMRYDKWRAEHGLHVRSNAPRPPRPEFGNAAATDDASRGGTECPPSAPPEVPPDSVASRGCPACSPTPPEPEPPPAAAGEVLCAPFAEQPAATPAAPEPPPPAADHTSFSVAAPPPVISKPAAAAATPAAIEPQPAVRKKPAARAPRKSPAAQATADAPAKRAGGKSGAAKTLAPRRRPTVADT